MDVCCTLLNYNSWVPDETPTDPNTESLTQETLDENDDTTKKHHPYHKQARRMADLQLSALTNDDDDDDSTSSQNNPSNSSSPSTSFSTTMFVDFTDIYNYDCDLAEAIQSDYIRFEPFLRKALQTFLTHLTPSLTHNTSNSSTNNTDEQNPYFLAIHNLPTTIPLRSLRTDTIGTLTSFSATVTRTSDVRPELLAGSFRCLRCGILAEHIPQQYYFTRPTLCRNPRCGNARDFLLDIPASDFCDWQKLRVQETGGDVPPGCMPRSLDVVVRNEMVERCKAGDCIVVSGSLVVIPDGSALARAGEAPTSSRGAPRRGTDEVAGGGGGGARGLKVLGVRELTYRTCFVATSVMAVDSLARYRERVTHSANAISTFLFGGGVMGGDGDGDGKTTQEVANEMSEEEKENVREMSGTSNLYQKVR